MIQAIDVSACEGLIESLVLLLCSIKTSKVAGFIEVILDYSTKISKVTGFLEVSIEQSSKWSSEGSKTIALTS